MKNYCGVFLIAGVLLGSSVALAHEDERVFIELADSSPVQAGKIHLQFQLVDMKDKKILEEKDLAVLHEKKLHFFFFDPALKEFSHVHPEFIDSMWQVDVEAPKNGNYWLWAQGEIDKDQEEFESDTRLEVIGGDTENPLPPVLGEVRSGTDGLSKLTLSNTPITANQMVMLMLDFSRTDGSQPELSPYLGALAHVVAVSSDGATLSHVHPMGSGGTELMLHATFKCPGDYRLWIQFVDSNVLKTVPLSVHVDGTEQCEPETSEIKL